MMLVGLALLGLIVMILSKAPKSYPASIHPIPSPASGGGTGLGGGLEGFDSPYLGHTGSWDGKGGGFGGASKVPSLDEERGMGLRWTFMAVYWRALEPDGPVALEGVSEVPAAWRALDAFVIAAHDRGLNILMQAPVVGGNAGGPPSWAGRRETGKSAPLKMDALAEFAGKLAERYRPGGVLARKQGWGGRYGVRAWELDNEPEMYLTHWKGQAADYAEFATLVSARIKVADPQAVIVGPALASGKHGLEWLEAALHAEGKAGSPAFQERGVPYSIGPALDVVSLHNYEGMDSAFAGGSRTIATVLDDVRAVFEKWETPDRGALASPNSTFGYVRKRDYWHTEGNYDFVGVLSKSRRAAWRIQFFTRAFAAGLRKVCVMDASVPEQTAVRAYVKVLPWPFPMLPADAEVKVTQGRAAVFRHPEREPGPGGASQVWVLWALAGTGAARVEAPVGHDRVTLVQVDGVESTVEAPGKILTVNLKGDRKMAAPVLVVDGAPGAR